MALTGFGGLDAPGPGASIAQALKQGWKGRLFLSAWSYGSAANSAWLPGIVDRLQVLPSLDAGEEKLWDALVDAHQRLPIDVIIPGEGDVVPLARLADRLADLGIHTLLPSAHSVEALGRINLAKFLHERHLGGPLTLNVASVAEVPALADSIGYPLCVRGMHFGEQVVYSAAQARHAAEQLGGGKEFGVTLQYHVGGERYSVGLVADAGGHCRALVTTKILASNGEGRVVTGTIIDQQDIERFALEFVKGAQWRGPLTLELVQTSQSVAPLICDAACRLPAWCQASHWGGANLAVVLLDEILGVHRRVHRPRPGTMFVRGVTEAQVALDDLLDLRRHGRLESFSPVNGIEHPHLADEDPRGVVVAITGTSTFDVVNPGLGVAHALRQAPEARRIYGLSYGTLESGSYQPALFDEVFRLPDDGSVETLSQRISDIHRAHPFDVLIPCLDGELPRFIRMRKLLDELGIHYLLPTQKAFDSRSKKHLFSGRLREDWGEFSIPPSRFACSKAETSRAIDAVGVPAVVKGPLFGCYPANSLQEAQSAWQELAYAGWREVIVQRKITGASYATSVVCDRDHRCLSAVTIKKIAICQRGSTWSAVHVAQPGLEADFARFLQAIEWTGPGEGEFIRDEVTDRFYLIEVNPRFTGWIFYSAALGCNQPRVALRAALGRSIGPPASVENVAFVRRMTEFPIRASQLAALATKGYLRHA